LLVPSVLMNHGKRAVRIRGKRVAGSRSEPRAIDATADGNRRDYLAGLIVGDRHHAASAAAEQPMMRGIDGHGDRLLARGGWPAPRHRGCLRVDFNHIARVGEIRVYLAVTG